MFARTFIVKYITLKKCFCFLSDKHCRSIQQENVVKLSYGDDKCAYFSVGTFLPTLKENEIGINSMYAQTLQLEENQCVLLVHCNSVPGIKKVNIIPGSNDDYEIMELMAENVQLTLLDQIRIVNNGQKIVIWISNSLHIVVYIDGAEPVAPGRLDYLTEVVVKPPVLPKNDLATKPKPWNINWFLKYFNTTQIRNNSTVFSKYDNTKSTLIFRLYPLEDVTSNINEFNHEAYFNVFLQRDLLHDDSITNNMLFTFRVIQPPSENNDFDDPTFSRKSIVVRLCFLDFSDDMQAQNGCFMPLFISKRIFEHYNLKVGSKATLDNFAGSLDVNAIEISSNKEHSNNIVDKFKLYLANHSKEEKLLLNSEFPLDVGGTTVILNFTPSDRSACLIDGDFVRNCKLSVAESDFLVHSARNVEKVGVDLCLDCSNFQEIIDDCTQNLELGLLSNRLENILITGKPGTGKTTIANAFVEKVSNQKNYFHIETINCKNIKGKSTDSLHKLFTSTFLKLIYYQPSVLFLDDLHVICEKVADGDAATQESIHVNKVSELLGDLLDHYMKNHFICLLATSESTMKLNKHIFTPRGKHLFKNVFNILDLNKMDRTTFINYAFSKQTELDDFDMEDLALKTEGFVVQDLIDFVDKCIFESYKDETTKILLQQCEIALKNTTSLALKNVQLHSPGDRDFSDVGGLDDIKKVLVESLLWPAQFANIFGKAPLRLQSGLLLYGPPGTGKTILAGAAAKQCGLRLISIKGPELLSKYIGASEQAVRDVFQKAQSAKPCILFFDEFDSLAPRRGHDNTGVTDRVVNQFLTQLDGVEALTGVCVLAATSRPDLLDPALLRPGRLDRQILCPLPDKASRLEILKVLSKTLRLATDIDLDKIAEETKGFSGADLQGVLYTAQLTSVEHLLVENTESSSFENATEINRKHLEEAVKNTRPSLTRAETSKFERIYAKFQGKGGVIDVRAGKQRATLA